jgi:predicted ArsR family transcriptional regulator
MNQLAIDFDAIPHARRSDPETSKEAARRVREFARGQCAAILAVLQKRGPLGAEQIAAYLKIDAYAARKRLADLEHAGMAKPLPMQRVTASGRHERIWEAW